MTSPLLIEKFPLVAPLGLCFHDVATGERIADGLKISIYPLTNNIRKIRKDALPNRSGVYVLQNAYGLENFKNGAGDAEFWANNPPRKTYIAEVSDAERRFQSFQLTLKLPVKGIYRWENAPPSSPNKTLASIPLYSAPTRKITNAMSVVRAELRQSDGTPAAFAVLEARFDNNLVARGIADRDGKIVLIFPTLAPQSNPFASPPTGATNVTLAEQQWILDLNVKYQPSIFQTSPPIVAEIEGENLPDLRRVLAQSNGKIWTDAAQTEELKTVVLRLGKELILRSTAEIRSPPEFVNSSFLSVSPAS
jgi:hypothetical protein